MTRQQLIFATWGLAAMLTPWVAAIAAVIALSPPAWRFGAKMGRSLGFMLRPVLLRSSG